MSKTFQSKVLSVFVKADYLYTLVKDNIDISLQVMNQNLEIIKTITSFQGSKGFILGAKYNGFLVDIDDTLVLVNDVSKKIVLKANCYHNFFWHSTTIGDLTYVQEYGQPPTSIYVSKDLENWNKLVTNPQVDIHSKHFHHIAYDPYRNWLITLLGDGCMTRVAYSKDMGQTWMPLYMGAWQFTCVFPLKDKIVFGFDSGIVRGGIGVYNPQSDCWDFTFLKWYKKEIKQAQLTGLTLVNNLWIAALGTPQVILASKDLSNWYILHEGGFDEQFNFNVMTAEGKDFIVCCTGKSFVMFKNNELSGSLLPQPVLLKYNAYIERLKGLGFILKRKLSN
jgi:hypothetical protein